MTPTPSACAHCGVEQRDHFRRWSWDVGWHGYVPPSQELIKERMRARRSTT